MQTFDLDKLMKLVDNKFHLIIGIVERVQLLKRGVEAKVPRRNRDLITVAMEEMENDLLSFEVVDVLTEQMVTKHSSERSALVSPELAREEALAAQNATLGFGAAIDRRPLSMPAGDLSVDDIDEDEALDVGLTETVVEADDAEAETEEEEVSSLP